MSEAWKGKTISTEPVLLTSELMRNVLLDDEEMSPELRGSINDLIKEHEDKYLKVKK